MTRVCRQGPAHLADLCERHAAEIERLQRELSDLARESVARELKLARLEGEVERMRRSWWWAGG